MRHCPPGHPASFCQPNQHKLARLGTVKTGQWKGTAGPSSRHSSSSAQMFFVSSSPLSFPNEFPHAAAPPRRLLSPLACFPTSSSAGELILTLHQGDPSPLKNLNHIEASWRRRISFDSRSGTPHDSEWVAPAVSFDELSHTSFTVVEVLLIRLKLRCRSSASIPMGPDAVVSIVRFPFRLGSPRACSLQVPAHHVMSFSTFLNF